jgi:hypothetical protein
MTTRFLLALFALATFACQHDVRLEFPAADGVSDKYDCSVTSGLEQCTPSSVEEPARQNEMGTAFVILPKECQKHFHLIVVHGAGSSSPTVHVECAPPEGTIAPIAPITAPPAAPAPSSSAGAPSGSH